MAYVIFLLLSFLTVYKCRGFLAPIAPIDRASHPTTKLFPEHLRSCCNAAGICIRASKVTCLAFEGSQMPFVEYSSNFSVIDWLFFNTFAGAVASQLPTGTIPATSYSDLIDMINQLTRSEPASITNEKSKQMLVSLFPSWLLPSYRVIFGRFTGFSAWLNTWVTHWTTQWLMGPSSVTDLEVIVEAGHNSTENIINVQKQRCLTIEKCRFLEQSGCVQTCLHACKIPTQRFFQEEMALPVQLNPNFTDFSCTFEFGKVPVPHDQDERLLRQPCLDTCSVGRSRQRWECLNN